MKIIKQKDQKKPILQLKNDHLSTVLDNNSFLIYIEKFGYLPVIIYLNDGMLYSQFINNTAFSDLEIQKEIQKIIKDELFEVRKELG